MKNARKEVQNCRRLEQEALRRAARGDRRGVISFPNGDLRKLK